MFPADGIYYAAVYNSAGQVMGTESFTALKAYQTRVITLNRLPAGNYIVHLHNRQGYAQSMFAAAR